MRDGERWTEGLEPAVAAYKEGSTPETVTDLWREFWAAAGKKVEIGLTVEDFPGTAANLGEHLRNGDMPIYVPPEFAGQENRHYLGEMWWAMGSYSVKRGNRVTNEQLSNLLTGHYWDESTASRLPGSCTDAYVVKAYFESDGRLTVHSDWTSGFRDENLGGRSSVGV